MQLSKYSCKLYSHICNLSGHYSFLPDCKDADNTVLHMLRSQQLDAHTYKGPDTPAAVYQPSFITGIPIFNLTHECIQTRFRTISSAQTLNHPDGNESLVELSKGKGDLKVQLMIHTSISQVHVLQMAFLDTTVQSSFIN